MVFVPDKLIENYKYPSVLRVGWSYVTQSTTGWGYGYGGPGFLSLKGALDIITWSRAASRLKAALIVMIQLRAA